MLKQLWSVHFKTSEIPSLFSYLLSTGKAREFQFFFFFLICPLENNLIFLATSFRQNTIDNKLPWIGTEIKSRLVWNPKSTVENCP